MLTWDELDESNGGPLTHYQVIRHHGAVIPFEPNKMPAALVMQALGLMLRTNLKLAIPRSIVLPKRGGLSNNSQTGKLNGFFSASKANLRNAP